MEPDFYDGIRVPELPIEEVDWYYRGEYIKHRSVRKPGEMDVEPEWATQAVMDPLAVIRRDRASRSGEGIRVTGYSLGASQVLVVILVPKDHPPTGAWWGANAWVANERDRRDYLEAQ